MSQNGKQYIYDRLNAIYKDLTESLQSNDYDEGWNNNMENEILQVITRMKQEYPENDVVQQFNYTPIRQGLTSITGQTRQMLTQVRKIANTIGFAFELDRQQQTPQNVFNIVQSQSVIQNTSVIYENMISNINQLDLEIEKKRKVLDLVKEFKEESGKGSPNLQRLASILKEVGAISKVAGSMLSYWASASGILEHILHHFSH